ncbi:MAG: RNase adapter RapZ [Rhodospirillaceae bacterium]|nr:RNase adapter RapZ [Rhodospirillaceae bacterium]
MVMIKQTEENIVVVTGLSGAGRSTCLKILEDHGYDAVDNLPLTLINPLLKLMLNKSRRQAPNKIAIGIDPRTRNFDPDKLLRYIEKLRSKYPSVSLVFLDCDDKILVRRFTETRRKHPLALDRPVIDGIREERLLLKSVGENADLLLDSSGLTLPQFHTAIKQKIGIKNKDKLTLTIVSFGFRNGLPNDSDMIFDVRFLANPYYQTNLRSLDGKTPEIATFIEKDPIFEIFYGNLVSFLSPLLPRYAEEGKGYLNIGIGCTGGQHRSVFVAEKLHNWLNISDHNVTLRHRDIEDN